MQINTDLSTDSALASRQNLRAEAGATASPSSSNAANAPAAGQMDPFLQRLASAPADAQDAQGIQDEPGAAAATEAARQSILQQPDTALAAQANSLSQNVLNLLQPAD
jgi:hypothetical protein